MDVAKWAETKTILTRLDEVLAKPGTLADLTEGERQALSRNENTLRRDASAFRAADLVDSALAKWDNFGLTGRGDIEKAAAMLRADLALMEAA